MISNLPNAFTACSTADFTSDSFPTSAFIAIALTLGQRSTMIATPFSAAGK